MNASMAPSENRPESGRLDVLSDMAAIELNRAPQAIPQRNSGRPAGCSTKGSIICVIVADIDHLAIVREVLDLELSSSIDLDQHLGKFFESDGLRPADIENLALRFRRQRGEQERFGGVLHVSQIPELLATPHFEGGALEQTSDPEPQED